MNGCQITGTPIVVDMWKWTENSEKKVYFLSHLHCDHMRGLKSSWRIPFYTSPANSKMLKEKFEFRDGIVIPLELDEPHIITLDISGQQTMTVTLLDANHVPGSVMFFFQGFFGNILYCADTRFYPEIFEHPALSRVLKFGGAIDRLYIDNTFCHPSYSFPSRETATKEVFKIIEAHPNDVIKLGIRKLGKEDLLEAVAQKFQERILVSEEKYKQLKILKRPSVYTTDPKLSRIHAVPLFMINCKNYTSWNCQQPTVCIRLTALEYGFSPDKKPFKHIPNLFTVPYSDHSSWGELVDLVKGLRPKKIIPIVKKSSNDQVSAALEGREDMSIFNEYLSSSSSVASPSKCFEAASTGVPNVSETVECPFNRPVFKNHLKKTRRRALSKGPNYIYLDDDDENGTKVDENNSEGCNEGSSKRHNRMASCQENCKTENSRSHLNNSKVDSVSTIETIGTPTSREDIDCSPSGASCYTLKAKDKIGNLKSKGKNMKPDRDNARKLDSSVNFQSHTDLESCSDNLPDNAQKREALLTELQQESNSLLELLMKRPSVENRIIIPRLESFTRSLEEIEKCYSS